MNADGCIGFEYTRKPSAFRIDRLWSESPILFSSFTRLPKDLRGRRAHPAEKPRSQKRDLGHPLNVRPRGFHLLGGPKAP
jgi:hypothetical protein